MVAVRVLFFLTGLQDLRDAVKLDPVQSQSKFRKLLLIAWFPHLLLFPNTGLSAEEINRIKSCPSCNPV